MIVNMKERLTDFSGPAKYRLISTPPNVDVGTHAYASGSSSERRMIICGLSFILTAVEFTVRSLASTLRELGFAITISPGESVVGLDVIVETDMTVWKIEMC